VVLDAASPGPKQGTKYLEIKRTGGQNTGRAEATFTPLADGETLSATFAFQYVSNGFSSAAFGLFTGPNNSNARVTVFAEPDFAAPNFYTDRGSAFDHHIDTSLPVSAGHWQTIGIQYTQGSTDLKLTVDGTTEVLTDAVLVNGAIDRIRFGTANDGTDYFL